jgi:hypothetical protein
MNTNNQQSQQLFGEPQWVEGTAGKKEVAGEPLFVTGLEKHAEQIAPLYVEPPHGIRTDPYQNPELPIAETPGSGVYHIPIVDAREQLYPGQENFIGKYTTPGLDGKEHLTSGGTVPTTFAPLQVSPPETEHVHLQPSENVHLTPDAEHVHIKAGDTSSVEKVIRIKPDGRIQVTAEKVQEPGTEQLIREEPLSQDKEKLSTVPKKERDTEHRKDYDPSLTENLQKPRVEETEVHTKKGSKKKHDKGRHHTTETQTIVKVKEHEPGTAGYTKEKKVSKHDDSHHRKHDDTHHHKHDDDTTVIVDKAHGVPNVKVSTGKTDDTHGTDTTKVKVDKAQGTPEHVDTEHVKTGKTSTKKHKHAADKTKHHHGTHETNVTVGQNGGPEFVDTEHVDTEHVKTGKTSTKKHKHASDKTKHHHVPNVLE